MAMPGWQVAWMWLSGLVNLMALWVLMHINEIGCYHIQTVVISFKEF